MVRGLGVEFEMRNVDPAGLTALEHEFDAMFLGVGLGAMRRLTGGDGSSANVIDALEFIAGYKTGRRLSVARRVVVIGAGNTAIDAACAAKLLGAEEVTILYRRQREHISAFAFEYEHAVREGVAFRWASLPTAFAAKGNAIELKCVAMTQDEAGLPAVVEGSEFTIDCDIVIPAIGQSPLLELLSQARGVAMENGRVLIDRGTGQTTNPKYFAGGDCVNGGREVVDAVADGNRAALGIAGWLGGGGKAAEGGDAWGLRAGQDAGGGSGRG